jgi:hypothetical protein
MGCVITDLAAADIDRLEGLWRELLDHHLAAAPHLAALGTPRDPAGSWRVRRAQYPVGWPSPGPRCWSRVTPAACSPMP